MTVNEMVKDIPASEKKMFLAAVDSAAEFLQVPAIWLLAIIKNESGFSPSIRNPLTNSVGLIQFMPDTAAGLGTSTDRLAAMSRTGQMVYVEKYFAPKRGKYHSVADLYLYAFYPYALGQPPNYVIGSERGPNYARKVGQQNKSFDLDHDGVITVKEFRQYVKNKWPELQKADLIGKIKKNIIWILSALLFIILIFALWFYRKSIFPQIG